MRDGSASSWASTGSGRQTACGPTVRMSWSADLSDLLRGTVIKHPAFSAEPWALREYALDLDYLAQSESLFALANGHIGLRGNLDEGEPFGIPGTYLAGFHELAKLPYAEAGYGYPEASETVVNVTNGKLFGCSSRTSRSTSATAPWWPRAGARPACGRVEA